MAGQSNNFDGTSVSGGFNVQGNQFNGPVNIGGSNLHDTEDLQCLRLLKTVSPEDERRRILTVKDQLVTASYSWILEDENFRSWLDGDTNHLLWIKGGPGKGKTMMMAGLVEVLPEARASEGAVALSYFFCQNSESELRKVTSIVKGLIYMLAFRERNLIHHLKRKYEAGGEEIFTGPRALFALWHVLEDMLRDFHGTRVYLIVDGLDECDDPEFDDFLYLLRDYNSSTPGKIKWLVTSRPLPRIEDIIRPDQDRYRISLEIEAQHVSQGVEAFISEKVNLLRLKKNWTEETTQTVHSYLQRNAEGTFLWVALVCQRLRRFPPWKVKDELTKLAALQRGLNSFYERMMQVVRDEIPEYADLCMRILRTTTLAYRPLRLQELGTVVALPYELQSDDSPSFDALRDLIERCGSFILVHEDTIYFVHQSAKDYLREGSNPRDFSLDRLQEHTSIAEKCLDTLNSCLKDREFQDSTSLSKQELGEDESRLLSRTAYACSYWIYHTLESVSQTSFKGNFPNQGKICNLLESHLIAWVHALGSLKEMTACVRMMNAFLDMQGFESTDVFHMMQETYRFMRQSRHIIEESPNQAYTSALLFLPQSSWIREKYQNHIPKWIKLRTRLNHTWDACLETLMGHREPGISITFSSDGSLLASESYDSIRLWETETGKCCRVLSHAGEDAPLAFSPDDRVLVRGSNRNLELLDTTTGSHQILLGHNSSIKRFLIAPNSQILASADDVSVRIWNISTRSSCGIFEYQGKKPRAMDFSHDSKRIVIAFGSDIQVRDVETLNIVATFREHRNTVRSVQFSPDSRLILSVSDNDQICLWNHATPKCWEEQEGSFDRVKSAKFSPNGRLIVSIHDTETSVILWETLTGNRLHILPVRFKDLCSGSEPMFSPDSKVIVTPLSKGAKSWDTTSGEEIATLGANEDASGGVSVLSRDGKLFAQSTNFKTRIWEVATGILLRTLEGHSGPVFDLAFSPVGDLIASTSIDCTVKLWSLNKNPSNQATIRNEIAPLEGVGVSSDGTLAASISSPFNSLRLWDLESGSSRTLQYIGCYFDPRELIFSPDSSLIAVKMEFGVVIWETKSGSLHYETEPRRLGPTKLERITFSPDSLLLKIEHSDGSIRLVENHTRGSEDVPNPFQADSTQSHVSSDGRFAVGLDSDFRFPCLWEQQKGTGQAILKSELIGACSVPIFSPDSRLIAFVSTEHCICVWETETGVCLGVHADTLPCTDVVSFSHDNRFIIYTFGHEHNLGLLELSTEISWTLDFGCAEPAKLVKFSPDASIVAAASGSAILLWKTPSVSPARKLECDKKQVSDITFLPDRTILIVGHEDGTIRSWDTNSYALLYTLYTFCRGDCPPRFSLDSERKFLWTRCNGYFFDEFSPPPKKTPIQVINNWVLFNGERIIWLPTEFRPFEDSVWGASGKSLAIGHHSGYLTSVNFDI